MTWVESVKILRDRDRIWEEFKSRHLKYVVIVRNLEYTPLLNFKEILLKQHFSEATVDVQL